jgi:hypothetical protein
MDGSLKWLLIGGAVAAFVFRNQIEEAIGVAGAPAPQPPAAPADPAAAAATPLTPQSASDTRARMFAAARTDPAYIAGSGRMTPFQWDFYYQAVRGVGAPSPAALGLDGNMLLSLDEYWTAATAHGLSGLGRSPAGGAGGSRRRSLAAQAWGM